MKTKRILLTLILILVVASLAVVELVLRPQAENKVRKLCNTTYETPVGKLTVAAENISFSPYSGQVLVTGLTVKGDTTLGPINGHSAQLSAKMPLRAALSLTSLREVVLPEKGPFYLLDELQVSDAGVKGKNVAYSTANWGGSGISLDAAVLRGILAGKSPDVLTVIYALDAGRLFVRDAALDMAELGPARENLRMTFKSYTLEGRKGREIARLQIEDFALRGGTLSAGIGSLEEEGITLPEKVQAERILILLAQAGDEGPANVSPELQSLLEEILSSGAPLVKKVNTRDMTFGLDGEAGAGIKSYTLDWPSNHPLRMDSTLSGLTLPTDWLRKKLHLTFPGRSVLNFDMTSSISEPAPERRKESGSLTLTDLGSLTYNVDFQGKNASSSNFEKAMSDPNFKMADITVTYKDTGLAVCLLRSFAPNSPAATALLQSLLMSADAALSAETPGNAAIQAALKSFAERPGTLSLKSTPGKAYTLMEMIVPAVSGNLGAVFALTAEPGTKTLMEQLDAVGAQPQKAQ